MTKFPNDDQQIEEAIKFLASAITNSGRNPKPVILHSVRAGLHLNNLGYGKDIIIATILHDVVEDTDINIADIKSKFGDDISDLVAANTFDDSITDKTNRYQDCFKRCQKTGKEALVIKAADFYYNMDYYHLAPTVDLRKWLYGKLEYFIDVSKNMLKDEKIYQDLVLKYSTKKPK